MSAVLVAVVCSVTSIPASALSLDLKTPESWRQERRGTADFARGGVALDGKMALWQEQQFTDFDLKCRARIAEGVEDGSVWVRFRYGDDNEHYALALRGWPAEDLYMFRFSPGGYDRMLASVPLDTTPAAGRWYDLRIRCIGSEIDVFLNGEPIPMLSVIDPDPLSGGLVGVGGGYRPAEYADIVVEPVTETGVDTNALSDQAVRVNFQAPGPTPPGWKPSTGGLYSPDLGYGWSQDMSALARTRGLRDDALVDTTISAAHDVPKASFTIDAQDGTYSLLMAGGDVAFATHFEVYVDDETDPTVAARVAAGAVHLLARPVTVSDGKLKLTLRADQGAGSAGCSVAWVALEPQAANPELYATASARWQRQQERAPRPGPDRAQQRARTRGAHKPIRLPRAEPGRQTISLDGTWLFLPDQERDERRDPREPKASDARWHGIDVPTFWTPIRWWIYGPGEGTSDWWDRLEQQRMDALSFDPYETHAGWYRQWIEIPKEYSGRRLSLQFDAVAMRCEVWYNGQHVGGHVGMFAPLEIELPAEATRFGAKNLVTVFVSDAAWQGEGNPNEILGTAVTVEVTREMLQSLPRGMYKRSAGIWQPVRLISTEPAHMADVFVKTASDGFAADIAISGTEGDGWHVRGTVIDPATDIGLAQVEAEVTGETATLEATGIAPRTWSPDDPNLYPLRLELTSPTGEVTDAIEQQIGFRTFEVRGNRLYLNDRPYWLRGANHAPSGLSPNDGEVARSFMRGMHDGNTVVLRAHGSSFTPTWLTAADEYGVGVCMEGVWPWVMGDDADPPTDELLAIWESEWTGVMRRLRNHPSILLWTLNNESYWYRAKDPELRKRKWEIATRMIRNMREIDPTRPIVCDSGYVRDPETYAAEIEPNGFDDGDIDDAHLYYGWYWPSPWHLYPDPAADPDAPAPLEERFSGARPAISQEFATGYPNNDTGHPTRKYIDKYYVPQAWVGDYAYEDRDPSVFLDRHAWLAKELTEVARRHRDRLCGKLHFSNSNWFRFPFLPESHEPYPAYEAMRLAMAPILVSADLRRRHFYEGESIECDVYVINDSPDGLDLPSSRLEASIVQPGGVPLVRAAAQVAPVGYYDKHVVSITLPVPDKLGEPERNDYELQLVLKIGETELARNAYPMVGADSEWAGRDAVIQAAVEPLTAGEGGTLVARGRDGIDALKARPELQQFVEGGGRVLIMNAGEHVARLLPEVIVSEVPWRPEIVNFEDEASPILDGLEPWDICWFNGEPGEIPVAATGGFLLKPVDGVRVLATAIRPHGYLAHPTDVQDHTAAVVFEAQLGKGKVIVSELDTAAAVTDPIAARVVSNLLKYLGDGE